MLGRNGQVGTAAVLRLAADGWEVTSSGRSADRFPQELREAGAGFTQSDRYATGDLRELLHRGADAVISDHGAIGRRPQLARGLRPEQGGRGLARPRESGQCESLGTP